MPFDNDELEKMRNDPGNYQWGLFYYNTKDPRFILPKRNRLLGWTVNFANPYSYLIITVIIVLVIFMESMFSK